MSGLQISRSGNGPGAITSFNTTITGPGSVPINLLNPCNQVTVTNYSNFPLFLNFNGLATPQNYAIPAGGTFYYDGPAVSGFNVNSNGQTINYGVIAY